MLAGRPSTCGLRRREDAQTMKEKKGEKKAMRRGHLMIVRTRNLRVATCMIAAVKT